MAGESRGSGGLGFRSLQGGSNLSLGQRVRTRLHLGPTDPARTRIGVGAGLLVLLPIVLIDILIGGQTQLVVMYVLATFAASLASISATATMGALIIALAAVSPLWNHNYGSETYWLRLGGVIVACVFAIYLASRWRRASTLSARLSLLDEISAVADGSLALDETLAHALEQITPGAADFCMIDTIRDGEVTRIGTRVRGRPDWRVIEEALRAREPSTPPWLRNPQSGIPLVPMFLPRVTPGHEEILSHDAADLAFLRSLCLRSVAIVPMIARGRLLGTLTLAVAWSGRSYDRDDLAFARALTSRLALALDHAGLFSDLESVERRMDAVMARIPEAVTVRDHRGRIVYANDVVAEWVGARTGRDLIGKPVGWIEDRLEIHAEGDADWTAERVADTLHDRGSGSRLLVRLVERRSGRERWALASNEVIRGPDGDVLYTVSTTEDVTISKRTELSERLLATAGACLTGAADLQDALGEVAAAAVPALADECSIALLGRGVGANALEYLGDEGSWPAADDPLVQRIINGAETLRIEVPSGPAIGAPLIAGESVIGMIAFANRAGGRPFSDADLALVGDIGSRLGTAIEGARLATIRREIAATLQRALEPEPLPDIDGWRLESMYQPAGELNDVGGDFYEVVEVENGWMVVVGDVLGRGATAAALTAVARNMIRAALTLTGDPREALRILNDHLCGREERPLCSVAIVVLPDTTDGGPADAVLTCAGHPLPLLIRGEKVTEACGPGPLLGAIPDAEWSLELVPLSAGDQLVIYTDGVIEARIEGGFLGEDGLAECLRGAPDPKAAVKRIEAALAEQAVDVADDAAAVAVMRVGAGEERHRESQRPRLTIVNPG
jgi:PAS domain S-box-containing protein